MQTVMRNPLADPGVIGVTSGAAFAAVLVSSFFPSLAMFTPLFSFLGGITAFAAVYLLAWSKELAFTNTLTKGNLTKTGDTLAGEVEVTEPATNPGKYTGTIDFTINYFSGK